MRHIYRQSKIKNNAQFNKLAKTVSSIPTIIQSLRQETE